MNLTSNSRRYGESFKQFVWFREQITSGVKAIIIGPKYVVMSTKMYNELQANATPPIIEFRSLPSHKEESKR